MKKKFNPLLILEGLAGAGLIALTILFSALLRKKYSRWGATPEEVRRRLPGDTFVPNPRSELTNAITIQAPPEKVWPWFVQLGCLRGGWYSYDLLDNGGIPSADRIVPKYQDLRVGDTVKATPDGSFGFPAAIVEPERVLSLAGTMNTATGQSAEAGDPSLEAYFSGDQTFYLEPVEEKATRLIFRMRTDWNPTFMNNLIYGSIVEPISFVMGRKMLRTLKRRNEGAIREDKK
jgi:proline iminopeptidase